VLIYSILSFLKKQKPFLINALDSGFAISHFVA